jgi:hypothetical protein
MNRDACLASRTKAQSRSESCSLLFATNNILVVCDAEAAGGRSRKLTGALRARDVTRRVRLRVV